ncbi:thioredoxin family protein [Leucobacter sp. W1153]|uniref:thioredoxin family protein n=1 Tax=Leucobacter sp. W1153 TaxID=3439064 RepID=UPI003F3EAE68
MDVTLALIALGVLVLLAAVLGVCVKRKASRVRAVSEERRVDIAALGLERLGDRATIVQFSTEMCSRCPGVRRTITGLVEEQSEVAFVHVDVTHRPELARAYNLLQTPTVLVLDDAGRPRSRLTGAITRQALTDQLESVIGGVSVAR